MLIASKRIIQGCILVVLGTLLAVANSGVVGGLLPVIGSGESDLPNIVELTEEFSLIP